MNKVDINKAASMLLENDNVLIISHKNPDGDTVSSAAGLALALKRQGKTCAVLCQDEISSKYDYMNIELFTEQFTPEYIVSVDAASQDLLGSIDKEYSSNVNLCIDHHETNSNYADYTCCYADLPATAQLIYYILKEMNVEIDEKLASILYTGILTDTGCFKYSSTDSECHLVAADLLKKGADHINIVDKFFMSKSKKTIQIEKYALNSLEFYLDDKCAIVAVDEEIIQKINPSIEDMDIIKTIPRTIDGVEVGVSIRAISDDTFKVSLRTNKQVSASEIAQSFGGGGHEKAAACEISGTLESVKKAILREVEMVLCN